MAEEALLGYVLALQSPYSSQQQRREAEQQLLAFRARADAWDVCFHICAGASSAAAVAGGDQLLLFAAQTLHACSKGSPFIDVQSAGESFPIMEELPTAADAGSQGLSRQLHARQQRLLDVLVQWQTTTTILSLCTSAPSTFGPSPAATGAGVACAGTGGAWARVTRFLCLALAALCVRSYHSLYQNLSAALQQLPLHLALQLLQAIGEEGEGLQARAGECENPQVATSPRSLRRGSEVMYNRASTFTSQGT